MKAVGEHHLEASKNSKERNIHENLGLEQKFEESFREYSHVQSIDQFLVSENFIRFFKNKCLLIIMVL